MDIKELSQRSKALRDTYHQLEIKQDGKPWNPEQDALSFLTDAGLVGRKVMDKQGSWPDSDTEFTLDYKIAETIWWLATIADAHDIDLETAIENFLQSREADLH